MLPLPAIALPAFDQNQVDKRFLTELDRLLQAGMFATYREWAEAVGVAESTVNGIASGRYHCNIKLLYGTVRAFPSCDVGYVLFGSAVYARPEPTEAPVRKLGRGPKARPTE